MANSTQLTDWVIANAKRLELAVTRVGWVEKWLPGYHDYQVKISLRKNIYAGRGIDRQEQIAFEKSVSEALERAATRGLEYPWTTAAYENYDGAKLRAYQELLGMDRVCKSFASLGDFS